MKNNGLLIVLVIIVSIGSGVGLLFGITNLVNTAVAPVSGQLTQISANEARLSDKLAALEKKIGDLEDKMRQQPQAAPQIPQPPAEDMNKVYDIPVGNSPIFGDKNAKVTIVEFTDLQCPFCSRFSPPLHEALQAYSKGVRLIVKNFPLPFHPNARPAAKLAFAAGEQGKYHEMIVLLLENGAQVDDAKIKEYAEKLKLNAKKLADDYKNKDAQWEAWIQEDEKLVQAVDVRGTPTFFLNGKKTNARDVASWKAAIDKALAE